MWVVGRRLKQHKEVNGCMRLYMAIAGRANGFTLHLVNTCVQSNLAKAFVTDKHESLNRIRQVAEN